LRHGDREEVREILRRNPWGAKKGEEARRGVPIPGKKRPQGMKEDTKLVVDQAS